MKKNMFIGAALLLLGNAALHAEAEKKSGFILDKAQTILEKYNDPFAPVTVDNLLNLDRTPNNAPSKKLVPVPDNSKISKTGREDDEKLLTFSLLGYIENSDREKRAILNVNSVGDFVVKGGEVLTLSRDEKNVTRILVSNVSEGYVALQVEGQPGVTEVR